MNITKAELKKEELVEEGLLEEEALDRLEKKRRKRRDSVKCWGSSRCRNGMQN